MSQQCKREKKRAFDQTEDIFRTVKISKEVAELLFQSSMPLNRLERKSWNCRKGKKREARETNDLFRGCCMFFLRPFIPSFITFRSLWIFCLSYFFLAKKIRRAHEEVRRQTDLNSLIWKNINISKFRLLTLFCSLKANRKHIILSK